MSGTIDSPCWRGCPSPRIPGSYILGRIQAPGAISGPAAETLCSGLGSWHSDGWLCALTTCAHCFLNSRTLYILVVVNCGFPQSSSPGTALLSSPGELPFPAPSDLGFRGILENSQGPSCGGVQRYRNLNHRSLLDVSFGK